MDPSPLPSPPDIEQIAALIQEANAAGDSATAHSAQRLRTCVAVGTKLIEWKKAIPRGEWSSFLEKHFPDLVERSGQRWMRLAEASANGTLNLDNARGLRHAYQLAGLLPDADSGNAKGGSKPKTFVVHIARLVAALQHITLDSLSASDLNEVNQRFRLVRAFLEKLDKRLSAQGEM